MTEPRVASSDATNVECAIRRVGVGVINGIGVGSGGNDNDNGNGNGDGDGNSYGDGGYVITGRKWWTSGAMDPRCAVCIVMGRVIDSPGAAAAAASRHRQQSMILVPMHTPGVDVMRALTVFGYDDAPHGHAEVAFNGCYVDKNALLGGEGDGFAISQARLGPGRIHHCMRAVGMAELALELLCRRAKQRHAFGTPLAEKGTVRRDIADSRIEIDQARLLTVAAAAAIDAGGARSARALIAQIKVAAPQAALSTIDRAMQVR
jgi:acyl-CoA dehydrogenase